MDLSKRPYVLVSDVHCHNWSQFASIGVDGLNSRLATILDELLRAAKTIKAIFDKQFPGETPVMRVAGDLFHVRGKIEPSVFNPTFSTFKEIAEMGIDIEIIPGNHDLEGVTADTLGNAMQQLDLIEGIHVVTTAYASDDDGCVMLPWIEDLAHLEKVARAHAIDPNSDLIIHAPLNGVIKGLPDHGLDPIAVSKWGYKRVFVGHYHNHREPTPGVFSVGATTHQTWSDPGTAAGFLIVWPDKVEFFETEAPKFINLDDPTQLDERVKGNFVRIRFQDAEPDDLAKLKDVLKANGCAGFVDHSTKKRPSTRGVAAPQNLTLEVSVAQFVANDLEAGNLSRKRIANDALDVLREARTVGAE